jgi:hypothetical protein
MGYNLIERENMTGYFDVNAFCDTLDSYSVFEDVADSLDFQAVGIRADKPAEELEADEQKMAESNKKESVKPIKNSLIETKRRGKKPGQKGICSVCKEIGHNKRTCPSK